MTYPNQNSQQPINNNPRKLQSWQHFLLKAVVSILLPYLISSPDISIHIHHINIMF